MDQIPSTVQDEWIEICRVIGKMSFTQEDNFVSSIFYTNATQSERLVEQIASNIKIDKLQTQIQTGIKVLIEELTTTSSAPQRKKNIIFLLEQMVQPILKEGCCLNDIQKERLDIATAFGISTESLNIVSALGLHLLDEMKWKEAVGLFTLLIFLQLAEPSHWFRRALAFHGMNDEDEAIDSLEGALVLQENQPEYHIALASCLASRGNLTEARGSLSKANSLIASLQLDLTDEYILWKEKISSQLGL